MEQTIDTPMPDATAGDTTASVQGGIVQAAGGSLTALSAAVADNHNAAAPSGELEQLIAMMETRLQRVEAFAVQAGPTIANIINTVAPIVGAAVPAAAPALSRLPVIESTLAAVLSALGVHFGAGKIPGLPTAIPAPATPPAAPVGA